MSNDALFAVVVGLYGMGALAVICLVTAAVEGVGKIISRAAERKRIRRSRGNYVRFM